MTTLPKPLVVEHTLSTGQRRRHRWEPRSDGPCAHYEEEHDAGEWRSVGRKTVDDVDIERGEEVELA